MFEPADRLGGVLRTEQVGGQPIDIGAEAFIARRPEVPALLAELGLADRQIGTTGVRPLIYSQGRLHELPRDTLNGIPADPSSMTGLVDDATIAADARRTHAAADLAAGRGPAVADLVGDRFGEQVVTRSVDPLLAGVYAGSAATIGLRSAVPTLAAVLDRGAPSLTDAVREALPPPTERLGVRRDRRRIHGVARRAGPVRRLRAGRRSASSGWTARTRGWRLVDDEGGAWHADAVLLAVPAPRLATIVAGVAPRTAAAARQIKMASTALVALALPGGTPVPERSGVLVAGSERLHAKAITLSSRKWGRARQRRTGAAVVRPVRRRPWPAASATTTCWRGRPRTSPTRLRRHQRTVRLPGAALDRRDAAVRAGPRPTLSPNCGPAFRRRWRWQGRYLDGIGVPACIAAATRAAAVAGQQLRVAR